MSLARTTLDSAAPVEPGLRACRGCQDPLGTSEGEAGPLGDSLVELVTLGRVLGRAGTPEPLDSHPSAHWGGRGTSLLVLICCMLQYHFFIYLSIISLLNYN